MADRVRSVDATRFAMVPRSDIPRSALDISHGHKTTFNGGHLVPVYVDEVLPGDSFRVKMTAFCRMSTPIVPLMDSLQFESFFFFVPNRLLWNNWERFMGEQNSPTDSTQFMVPYIDLATADMAVASLADYFGLTANGSANTLRVSALPFRAYNQIYNAWFRDQDLQTPRIETIDDGPDDTLTDGYALMYRNKRHDYFTSARPWPQKPVNVNRLPASGSQNATFLTQGFQGFEQGGYAASEGIGAPVVGLGTRVGAIAAGPQVILQSGGRNYAASNTYDTASTPFVMRTPGSGDFPDVRVLVNDLRTAVLVQQMLERNARGGTRYTEIVRSHFGVMSPDARLQRPEYLGGGRSMIQVNPVAQTSASGATGTTTKLGEMAAIASTMVTNHGFSASFTEHGIILGIVNVRSYLTYQQGNERMWYRRTQFDYYWPGLANLGEQAILSQEIYADGSVDDVLVFGYQERWSEYKYKPSRTSGYFRSTRATPLDMWHLGQEFIGRPPLNGFFVSELPPISRVSQVNTNFGQEFLFDSVFDIRKVTAMPMYSIPGVGARL